MPISMPSILRFRDGDVFLQDDPWVGTNHQMDTAVFGPVFWEGRLFAWVYNCAHQRELGGSEPGGFIQDATSVYTEATFMPPIKLVREGELQEDVVDAWTRRSRLPEVMVLELKSQLAGFNFAKRRLLELLERYGPEIVKGTMTKMIDVTSATIGARLELLPDAVWRDERYVAGAVKGDNSLYKVALSFQKRGDRLLVRNEGTDRSVGSFNITRGVLRAVVLNALFPVIAYDQYLCGAGVLRQLDFELEDDAITSAQHPAAVSTSLGTLVALAQAHNLVSKMVSAHPDLEGHGFAAAAAHTASYNGMSGIDQYGGHYHDLTLDTVAGGIGGFASRDGIHHGGPIYASMSPIADVEKYEQVVPFLYLYRREVADSGGHGEHRGGCTLVSAWVGHKTKDSVVASGGLLKSVTQGHGLVGGFPATGGYQWHAAGSEVRQWFAAGRLPLGPETLRELAPHGHLAPPKKYDNVLGADDVFEVFPNPGAGYGDPLDRDPASVIDDVDTQRLSPQDARVVYGLALELDGQIDLAATDALRRSIRDDRLARARAPRTPGPERRLMIDGCPTKVLRRVASVGGQVGCASCGQILGHGAGGYRPGCAELDVDLADLGSSFTDPEQETGERLVFRRYLCPSCGIALDGQICRPDDLPYVDVALLS